MQYYWGDGSEEQGEGDYYLLSSSLQGGWQLEHEYMFGNIEIDAMWGYIYLDLGGFCEDFDLIGSDGPTHTFQCYDEGIITLKEENRVFINTFGTYNAVVCLEEDDSKKALKIAQDMVAKYKAEREGLI